MPRLGSFAGEFEQTYARAGAAEEAMLSGQEVVRYAFATGEALLPGVVQVLYSPGLIAIALEYIGDAAGGVDALALAAEPFLPEDASFVEEPVNEPERLLRRYASIALGDVSELNTLSTDSDGDEPAEPGTLTLEVTPSRWLIRPGSWSSALPEG